MRKIVVLLGIVFFLAVAPLAYIPAYPEQAGSMADQINNVLTRVGINYHVVLVPSTYQPVLFTAAVIAASLLLLCAFVSTGLTKRLRLAYEDAGAKNNSTLAAYERELRRVEGDNCRLQKDVGDLDDALRNEKEAAANLQEQLARFSNQALLDEQIRASQQLVKRLEEQLAEAECRTKKANERADRNETANASLNQVKGELTAITKMTAELQKSVQALTQERDNLRIEKARLEASKVVTPDELKSLREELSRTQRQLVEASTRMASMVTLEEHQKFVQSAAVAESQLRLMEEQSEKDRRQYEELFRLFRDVTAKIDSFEGIHSEIRLLTQHCESILRDSQQDTEQLTSAISDLREATESTTNCVERARNTLNEFHATAVRLEEKKGLREIMEGIKSSVEQLRTRPFNGHDNGRLHRRGRRGGHFSATS